MTAEGAETSRPARDDARAGEDAARTSTEPSGAGGESGSPAAEPRTARSAARKRSFAREAPVLLVVALALSLLLKAFVIQAFYIPSGSMEDTLQVGDRVLVNKLSYDIRDVRRGEIVVFNGIDSFTPEVLQEPDADAMTRLRRAVGAALGVAPSDERDFIKRVIGIPGDRVRCCDKAGRVTVNGIPLDEPYLFPGDRPSEMPFDVRVPKDRLWVMGDHRSKSADSRIHVGDPGGGMVPVDRVIGRAFVVVWPVPRWRLLSVPETFEQPKLAAAGR